MVALFTEMYGLPLTVYLLSGWLGSDVLRLDLTHDGGHLWSQLIGWNGDPHLSPFHLASYVVIGGGFVLMAAAWPVLFAAQQDGEVASTGPYEYVRHPQYAGFFLIMLGFLLQWPTLPTLFMFPVLLAVYRRQAIAEEAEVRGRLGDAYDAYAAVTPRFVPTWNRGTRHSAPGLPSS
jgi:protein-S-isoprenylcysteine O-methyltransferase Ste14